MASNKITIAFYDAMEYDERSFKDVISSSQLNKNVHFEFLKIKLSLQTASLAQGAEAVCIFVNDNASAEVLAKLSELGIKLVLLRCAGFDNVDLRAAAELGLDVVRVPAYSPHAVAEHAVGLLLTLNRKIHRSFNRIRDGNFTLTGLVGFDLYGKTVGVIGTGKIGQCFVQIMLGFGCKVLAFDVYPSEEVKQWKNVKYVSLEEVFKNSDIISIHAPATPETTNAVNHTTINMMKHGVLIINTSRGVIIDSKALLDGIISRRIGGAGLDVYSNEKPYFFQDVSEQGIDDEILARLVNMPNVLVTSHQAYLTNEALQAIAETTCRSIKEFFLENKSKNQLTFLVPPPTANPAVAQVLSRRKSIEEQSQKAK